MLKDTFKKFYERLNPQQKEAVDTTEGPVMVVAGPGTGKTQVLTLRIANILKKTDVHPSNILALTFTESAASSMRRRLSEIIGSVAYAVHIRTFHGFCNEIIQDYPEEFPAIIGSTSMSDVEQIQLIAHIIDNASLEYLKPMGDPHYYVRPVLSAIKTLKQEGVSHELFSRIIVDEEKRFKDIPDLFHTQRLHRGKMKGKYITHERAIQKQKELATLYRAYQETSQIQRRYDFPDMIMEVLAALGDKSMLLQLLQEQFQYILVDEHQDTNRAQNMVMELLASFHTYPNIFIVGDEKQAIFRFQGASLENFLYFKNRYPEARHITLQTNYRSSQTILNAAENLLKSAVPLMAQTVYTSKPIRVKEFPTVDAEREFVISDIEQRIAQKTPPHEIAIFYRDNKDAGEVVRMLGKRNIAYAVESDRDLLLDHDIRKLFALFRAVHTFGSDESLLSALHVDFINILPLDVYILTSRAQQQRVSISALIRSASMLKRLGVEHPEQIVEFHKKLSAWTQAERNASFLDFIETVARESGFLASLLSHPRALEKLENFSRIFEYAKMLVENKKDFRLSDFMEHLAAAHTHQIQLVKKSTYATEGRVRLMTAHKAKGLEFDYVYIIHAFDGHWSNKRRGTEIPLPSRIYTNASVSETEDANNDERRLFYVAITRARKEICMTYPSRDAQGKELLPCQFIGEIKNKLKETTRVSSVIALALPISDTPAATTAGIKDAAFIRELFRERGLSVTALNNYLECPWKYFYTNLIRIPKPPEHHQMYGIAIHRALRDFFANIKTRDNTKKFLISAFTRALSTQALPEKEYHTWHARGTKALSGYYDTYRGTWPRNVRTEFEIYGIDLAPDIRITGKLDKLEFIGEGNEVNIVDYKTGKPKTRGDIEGKTKTSRGDIKRQIVFYNLLLDAYDNGRYRMKSAEIDFVEPDNKGKYKKELFIVQPSDIIELKNEIIRVANEIMNLKFWNTRCAEKTCEFCALRELMNENPSQ